VKQDPPSIVASGYDAMAGRYLAWGRQVIDPVRDRLFRELIDRLPEGAPVLDLGCGAGLPWTGRLAERFDVVGVDISPEQIRLARRNVPGARFVVADMAALEMPPRSLAAVTALYSVSHLPRDRHPALFRSIAGWLGPGGYLVAALGTHDSPDWTGEWLGVPMFFSAFDADTNRALLRESGFELVEDEVTQVVEPEGTVDFLWVLARRLVPA
jgi:SAM-dependent methyltransferase